MFTAPNINNHEVPTDWTTAVPGKFSKYLQQYKKNNNHLNIFAMRPGSSITTCKKKIRLHEQMSLRKRWAWRSIFTQSADFSTNRSFQPILLHLLRCLSVKYHYSHKIRTWYKNYPLISTLICDITQHRVVIPYRRFGTTYRLFLQGQAPWRWDR